MRRWTILVIPHDTDEPRSFAVSARAVRWAGGAALMVVLAAAVGIGAVAWRATAGVGTAHESSVAADGEVLDGTTADMDSLRATVSALHSALDTIRTADARLARAAGIPVPDSATLQAQAALQGSRASADSLLRRASLVAERIGAMADSASARQAERRTPSSVGRSGAGRRAGGSQR